MNNAPKLEKYNIILRQPVKEDIAREGALINNSYCSDIYMGIIKSDYFLR